MAFYNETPGNSLSLLIQNSKSKHKKLQTTRRRVSSLFNPFNTCLPTQIEHIRNIPVLRFNMPHIGGYVPTIIGVMWTETVLALTLVSMRLWIRIGILHTAGLDDYLISFSWVMPHLMNVWTYDLRLL
jgi:hypothetical protein